MVQIFSYVTPLVSAVLLLGVLCCVHGVPVNLKAASGVERFGPLQLMPRSQASDLVTVLLKETDNVTLAVCLPAEDKLLGAEVRFSFDGLQKEVALLVDGNQMGAFITGNNSNYGKNWNKFQTIPITFDPLLLDAGQHDIAVILTSDMDSYGVEIDEVSLTFDSGVTSDELACAKDQETTPSSGAVTSGDVTGEASNAPSSTSTTTA